MSNYWTHSALIITLLMAIGKLQSQNKELKRKNFESKAQYKECKRIVANVDEMVADGGRAAWHCVLDSLARAASLLPGNAHISYWSGRAELACGRPEKAYRWFREADSLYSKSPEMLGYWWAKACLQAGRAGEAEKNARRFIESSSWRVPDGYVESAELAIDQARTRQKQKNIQYSEVSEAIAPGNDKLIDKLEAVFADFGDVQLVMYKKNRRPGHCSSFQTKRYVYTKQDGEWHIKQTGVGNIMASPAASLENAHEDRAGMMQHPQGGISYVGFNNGESIGGRDLFRLYPGKEEKPENMGRVVNSGGDDYLLRFFHHGAQAWILVLTCYNGANCQYRLIRLQEPADCLAGVENDSLRNAFYRQRLLELSHTGARITDSMASGMISAPPVKPDTEKPANRNKAKEGKTYYYAIQIASKQGRPLTEQELKRIYSGGKEITEFREDGYYKYRVGEFETIEEADRYLEKCEVRDAYLRKFRKAD